MSEQLTNPAYVRILDRSAQRAYRAYGKKTGGKNYQGLPMPSWDELPALIQEAWRAAVDSVITGEG